MRKFIAWLRSLFSKVCSIFYVGATDMLPEPLSKEMEEYYIEKRIFEKYLYNQHSTN